MGPSRRVLSRKRLSRPAGSRETGNDALASQIRRSKRRRKEPEISPPQDSTESEELFVRRSRKKGHIVAEEHDHEFGQHGADDEDHDHDQADKHQAIDDENQHQGYEGDEQSPGKNGEDEVQHQECEEEHHEQTQGNDGEDEGQLEESDDQDEEEHQDQAQDGSDVNRTEQGEERSVSQGPPVRGEDGLFPGENYDPPEKIRLRRGRISRSSDCSSQVIIRYDVKTAIQCPCEDRACQKLINVGRWGVLGGGSTVCVHCGLKREGDWNGVGYGFMGTEDLNRHLNSAQCRKSRGLSTQKRNIRAILGEDTCYKIDHPQLVAYNVNKNGQQQKVYKCYRCKKTVAYRSRFMHHLNANHERDRS